jgi:hypothetical protein
VTELREIGVRSEFTSQTSPETMAHCIGRNAVDLNLQTSVLRGARPGTWEFATQIPSTISSTLVAGDVVPEGQGARATLYVTPVNMNPPALAASLAKGC